jgi:hypothetical protein
LQKSSKTSDVPLATATVGILARISDRSEDGGGPSMPCFHKIFQTRSPPWRQQIRHHRHWIGLPRYQIAPEIFIQSK